MELKLENGRPADTTGRLEKEIRTYDFLDALQVPYQRIDHENHEEERRRFLEHLRKAGASPELDEENLKCLEDGRLRLEESLYERLSLDDI